jgi:hypothetical protein
MNVATEKTKLFEYEEKEGDIIVIVWAPLGNIYDFNVYQSRDAALTELWNCYRTNHVVIHCSDDEIMDEHLKEVRADKIPPYPG